MSTTSTPARRSIISTTRRSIVTLLATAGAVAAVSRLALARRTPSTTEGPFYPSPAMRFADADNDLVRIQGRVEQAGGEIVVLQGRVLDAAGRPVAGARVEIWQCDVNGRYLHQGDDRPVPRDPAFQGFGHVVTGPDGAYAFRTIKPVPYPGRAPHIHVKVIDGSRTLTTQFYIAGHAQNERDGPFRALSQADRKAVTMTFAKGANGPEATLDIEF